MARGIGLRIGRCEAGRARSSSPARARAWLPPPLPGTARPRRRPHASGPRRRRARLLRHLRSPTTSSCPRRSSAPYPYDHSGAFPGGAQQPFIEPIPLAAWLLAITKRVRVAISVLVVPYRNPVVTAKQLATIDAMSGGRLIVGVGVGWWPEEFEAVAAPPFAERGAVTDEYIRADEGALDRRDDPRFDGKYYRIGDITMFPKPVQKPHPPIWVGGHTEPALRRTAVLGDAWHPIGLRGPAGLAPEELAEKLARIRTLARAAGRDPSAIRVAFRGPIDLWPARGRPPAGPTGEDRLLAGPPAKVVERSPRVRGSGREHCHLRLPTAGSGGDGRAHAARRPRGPAPPESVAPRSPPDDASSRPSPPRAAWRASRRSTVPATRTWSRSATRQTGAPTTPRSTPSPSAPRPAGLKRVRNIRANPRVALLIDHYEEDWARLRFVDGPGSRRAARRRDRVAGGPDPARGQVPSVPGPCRCHPRGRSSRSSPTTSWAGAQASDPRRAGRRRPSNPRWSERRPAGRSAVRTVSR